MDFTQTNPAMQRLVECMPARSVQFFSDTGEWETSQVWFDGLNSIYGGFTLDPCATAESAKCDRFYTRSDDGLSQPWTGKVFMNPPYGRHIGKWVKKAWEESRKGALVVCVLPLRIDTRWWHNYARRGHVYFLEGAPFPSAIVTFGEFFDS
jgi:phage N-6-adenine-methyltransferase